MMATENTQQALQGSGTGRKTVSSDTFGDLGEGKFCVLIIVYSAGGEMPCSVASSFLEHSGHRAENVAG